MRRIKNDAALEKNVRDFNQALFSKRRADFQRPSVKFAALRPLLSGEIFFILKKRVAIKATLCAVIFELRHLNQQHEQKYIFYRTADIKPAIKFDRPEFCEVIVTPWRLRPLL